jgi:acyl-CoA reductase-like NAD-dependent aldehyde dehydrogenase
VVDKWEEYLDLMVESIYVNGGRSCINCSSIWASRHTKEIAQALAERLGPVEVKPPTDPQAGLAAFTVPGTAAAIWRAIEAGFREDGVTHVTEPYGPRLDERERCAYLRPTIVHCQSSAPALAKSEYMFPFAAVIECSQEKMLEEIGYTLVGTAITGNKAWQQQLTDAVHIDRLNIGTIPTNKLDWLQPHEGNITEFLFRARAYQVAPGFEK